MRNNFTAWTLFLLCVLLSSPSLHAAEAASSTQPKSGTADAHAGHVVQAEGGTEVKNTPESLAWTSSPILKIRMGGESRQRRTVLAVPQNIVADRIDAYSNNPEDVRGYRQLPMEMAGARLDRPESGGFHWLTAREDGRDRVRVASTVHFFSERGAQNPTAMFMRPKHELEIIPQPHPREHSRYRANEEWQFLVRFNGKPVAGQMVTLETSNGSSSDLQTDTAGMLAMRVPDDFKQAEEVKNGGGHDHGMRRVADMVLAVRHVADGKTYLTAFNTSYAPDAFDQRSLALGLGFMLLGMAGAVPLLRRRNDRQPLAAEANNKES